MKCKVRKQIQYNIIEKIRAIWPVINLELPGNKVNCPIKEESLNSLPTSVD